MAKSVFSGESSLATKVNSCPQKKRPCALEREALDWSPILAGKVQQQRGLHRALDDKSRIPLGPFRIWEIVMDPMPIEGDCGIAKPHDRSHFSAVSTG